MDNKEQPKKKVKGLSEFLKKWDKEKAVSNITQELRRTLDTCGTKSDEEFAKDLRQTYKTFIEHKTEVPEDFKKQFAVFIGTKELGTKADSVTKPSTGATGNDAGNITEAKKIDSQRSTSNPSSGDGDTGSGKKEEGPKPLTSSSSPIISTHKNKKLEEEIEKLKKELAEEQKKFQDQKRKAEQREKELNEKEEQIKKDLNQKAELQKRYDDLNKQYGDAVNRLKEREEMVHKIEAQLNKYASEEGRLKEENSELMKAQESMKNEIHAYKEEVDELFKERHALQKQEKSLNRELDALKQAMATEKRKSDESIRTLIKERDDLRDRFSKVAGAKLSDENSDIADLSDPNRAMKLSEKFGQLYDDEWTNAFEALTDDKIGINQKEAIRMLLNFLQDCLGYCEMVKKSQLDILNNVFLHPIQSAKIAASDGMQGMRERARIASKEEKALRELRRQITVQPGIIEEVKQAFLVEVKSWEKKGVEKKHVDSCLPYLQKCAELCWLIALHEPPLFVKFDFKPGEKIDQNVYSVYSTSGTKMDFLVWPPLYNGENGGLLSKGTAEPVKSVKK